jgi:hypothetical protein
MTSRISDPTEIAEVDDVRPNLETPQHDGMQQWCDLYPAQPFGRPCGIERWRAAARGRPTHQGGGRISRHEELVMELCVELLPLGSLYIVGGELHLTPWWCGVELGVL